MAELEKDRIVWYDSYSHKQRRYFKSTEIVNGKLDYTYNRNEALEVDANQAKSIILIMALNGYKGMQDTKLDAKLPPSPFHTVADKAKALGWGTPNGELTIVTSGGSDASED